MKDKSENRLVDTVYLSSYEYQDGGRLLAFIFGFRSVIEIEGTRRRCYMKNMVAEDECLLSDIDGVSLRLSLCFNYRYIA